VIRVRELASRLPERWIEPLTGGALFAMTAVGARRIPVSILEGRTREEGHPAKMLLAGDAPWVDYLPERFFGETPACRSIGSFPVWQLTRVVAAHGSATDLTVIRLDRSSARRWLRDPAFLAVPEWIGTRIRVPDDLEPLLRSGDSIKRDMTLIRRNGFEAEHDQVGEGFEHFYERVYRSYTRNRYGDETYIRSERDLRRRLRRGGILWVLHRGERISGALYERAGDELSLLALGTLDGDFALARQGAVAALYYFAMQLAQRIGCITIDLRGCRPSLSDGVLAYKKKWGAVVCEKPETYYDWMVRWNRPSSIVREFFSHTPVVFRERGGFSALTGDETGKSQSLQIEGVRAIYRLTETGRIPLTQT
jgi:hypothetical protein